jgi:hypothetical protein
MQTYMDTFARFRTLGTLSQIETLMSGIPQLESFEKAQLGKASCSWGWQAVNPVTDLSQ